MTEKVFTLTEILKYAPESVPMLVDDLLPKIGLAGIIGDSDVGKSTFATQLGLQVANGESHFLNMRLNTEHKRVLFISTEDDVMNMAPRLKKMVTQLKYKAEDSCGSNFSIVNAAQSLPARIEKKITGKPHDLVIVDAFSDLLIHDGNSNSEVRRILNPYSEVASNHKCLILFVHHIRKSARSVPDKHDTIGSMGFEAKMRSLLSLQKGSLNNEIILKIAKGNYLPPDVKNKQTNLAFENLVFHAKNSEFIPANNGDVKAEQSKKAVKAALDKLGVDASKKVLFEQAVKEGYKYQKSKFYEEVEPLISRKQQMNGTSLYGIR